MVGTGASTDDRELVAARTGDEILLADRGAHARGDAAQECIARGMPERVVDRLETVEVERQHAHGDAEPPRVAELGVEVAEQQRTICKAGEGILERSAAQLGFRRGAVKGAAQHIGDRLQELGVGICELRRTGPAVGKDDVA